METILICSAEEGFWLMDSMIKKDYSKAIKKGWEQVAVYVYKDGTVAGMRLKAPRRAISVLMAEKPKKKQKEAHK